MAEIQEPYPEGIVVGPCICGSWPGGKCLKCPRTAPLTRITWDERGVRTVNGIPDDAPQQQAEPPPEWLLIKNILDEYGLQALDFVAEFKAAQQVVTIWKQPEQQAPFSPEAINTTQTAWKMGYEAAKAEQQQAEPVAWDKPSASFDEWWDSDRRRDNANPFTTDSFAYWAFEGWQAALAQRPWVGLTVEERNACLVSADPCEALADPEAKQLMEDIEEKLRSKNT